MTDSLRPIFPPTQPFIGGEALNMGLEVLDQVTRDRLAIDAARLGQIMAGSACMLGATLGYDRSTSAVLAGRFVEVSQNLPPEYREYLNQLIGAAASVLAMAGSQNTRPDQEGVAYRLRAVATTDSPSDPEVASPDTVDVGSGTDVDGTVATDAVAQDTEVTDERIEFVPLDEQIRFIRYRKVPQYLKHFLSEIFSDERIKTMSPEVCAVSAHILLEVYMRTPIAQYTEARKSVQYERLHRVFGLTQPAITVDALAEEMGMSDVAFRAGMRRVREQLVVILSDDAARNELLARAELIAKFDKHAIFIDQVDFTELDSGLVEVDTELVVNAGMGLQEASILTGRSLETEHDPRNKLKKYYISPVNMRNFVARVLPAGFEGGIKQLSPDALSHLTFQLTELYRGIQKPGGNEEKIARRIRIIERWTGLYEDPIDVNMLAQRMVISVAQLEAQIASIIKAFNERVSVEERKRLYDLAASQS